MAFITSFLSELVSAKGKLLGRGAELAQMSFEGHNDA